MDNSADERCNNCEMPDGEEILDIVVGMIEALCEASIALGPAVDCTCHLLQQRHAHCRQCLLHFNFDPDYCDTIVELFEML